MLAIIKNIRDACTAARKSIHCILLRASRRFQPVTETSLYESLMKCDLDGCMVLITDPAVDINAEHPHMGTPIAWLWKNYELYANRPNARPKFYDERTYEQIATLLAGTGRLACRDTLDYVDKNMERLGFLRYDGLWKPPQLFISRNPRALWLGQEVIELFGYSILKGPKEEVDQHFQGERAGGGGGGLKQMVHLVSRQGIWCPTSLTYPNIGRAVYGEWYGFHYQNPFRPSLSDLRVYTFSSQWQIVPERACTKTELETKWFDTRTLEQYLHGRRASQLADIANDHTGMIVPDI
jgi:hypothetical protein